MHLTTLMGYEATYQTDHPLLIPNATKSLFPVLLCGQVQNLISLTNLSLVNIFFTMNLKIKCMLKFQFDILKTVDVIRRLSSLESIVKKLGT